MLRRHLMKALLVGVLSLSSPVLAQEAAPQIIVTGAGQVSVVPDIATINIGVREEADTAAAAMAAMRDAMNAVFEQITAAGVAPADMRTGSIRLNQQYDGGVLSSADKPARFEAASSVTVIVRDINALGGVLDAVVEDGANDVNGLQFDVADRGPHVQDARRAAVADARAAAEVYAAAAGVTLGPILRISEGSSHAGPVMFEVAEMRSSAMPVAAGELTISRTVEIVYGIVTNAD